MSRLSPILAVIGSARRRLRWVRALEAMALAVPVVVAAELALLWGWRMGILSSPGARTLALTAAAVVPLVGLAAALGRIHRARVTSLVDRANELDDRLGTACDFADRLVSSPPPDPVTRAFMEAAIADGLAAARRADAARAVPLRLPRDLRAAGTFLVIGVAVASLSFGPTRPTFAELASGMETAVRADAAAAEEKAPLAEEDVDFARELVAELRKQAQESGDVELEKLARGLEAKLDEARAGRVSKKELLEELERLERRYKEGAGDDQEMLADLKKTGESLKKEAATRKLGEALEKGDLEEAKKELEKLADSVEKQALSPEMQKKLADSLERAAKDREERQRQADEKTARGVQRKKDEVRRLEKKLAEKPDDEDTKRRLNREKRELERLERDREKEQAERPKRRLERLQRDMKRAAEDLRNQSSRASRSLKDAAEETGGADQDVKQAQNQKKSQSQLADLKEALRRAKAKKNDGKGGKNGRQQRMADFQRRAGGGQGTKTVWQPRAAQGKDATGQGTQGSQGQLGGSKAGSAHDPDFTGDETARKGETKDQELTGVHGKGPSRRETILTSAQRGFAGASYKKVYADYRKVVEEVIASEKIPQGYKYYVKRYFQRIKPQEEANQETR